MTYAIAPSLVSLNVFTASYLGQVVENLNVLGIHDHSGSLGEGASVVLAGSSASGTTGSLVTRMEWTVIVDYNKLTPVGPITSVCAGQATIFSIAASNRLGGHVWGFRDQPGPPASNVSGGNGMTAEYYLDKGTYRYELYFVASPTGGVLTVYIGASNVIGEIDTYAATSSLGRHSASFVNSGSSASIPLVIGYFVSGSKNASSTGCQILIGPHSLRWVGS